MCWFGLGPGKSDISKQTKCINQKCFHNVICVPLLPALGLDDHQSGYSFKKQCQSSHLNLNKEKKHVLFHKMSNSFFKSCENTFKCNGKQTKDKTQEF